MHILEFYRVRFCASILEPAIVSIPCLPERSPALQISRLQGTSTVIEFQGL